MQDAIIILLTERLDAINDDVLTHIERKLRFVRQHRSLNTARPGVRDDGQSSASTTPATIETDTLSGSSVTTPSFVSDASSKARSELLVSDTSLETPSGPLGQFLYQLLFMLPEITEFFSGSTKEILGLVLARADGRIEILRKFGRPGELNLPDKLERFLADRSLALSHERYRNGEASIPVFAESLTLVKDEDKKLVISGTYRGKVWRTVEKHVGDSGISALFCCEHTLFMKGFRNDDAEKIAKYLELPIFKPILKLARDVSPMLQEMQQRFDKSVGVAIDTESTNPQGGECLSQAIGAILTLLLPGLCLGAAASLVDGESNTPGAAIVHGEGENS